MDASCNIRIGMESDELRSILSNDLAEKPGLGTFGLSTLPTSRYLPSKMSEALQTMVQPQSSSLSDRTTRSSSTTWKTRSSSPIFNIFLLMEGLTMLHPYRVFPQLLGVRIGGVLGFGTKWFGVQMTINLSPSCSPGQDGGSLTCLSNHFHRSIRQHCPRTHCAAKCLVWSLVGRRISRLWCEMRVSTSEQHYGVC